MLNNLRLGYAFKSAVLLFYTAVSAAPTEKIQARRNKRQLEENSSSLSQSITDAVNLDKSIKDAQNDNETDSDDDSDDEDDDKEDNKDSPNRSSTSATTSLPTATSLAVTASASATSMADTLPSATGAKFPLQSSSGSSSTARDLAVAGGTVGGIIFLALIGFVLYRWRASKKNNKGSWNNEKHLPADGPIYRSQQETPPSTLFGGHGDSSVANSAPRQHESIPAMPKPPPLVLIPRGSEKPLEDDQTFLLDRDSSVVSNLPPVYEEMRSPSQESSISQTAPYPNRSATTRKKLYASFQPPPIPESPEAEPMQSRFSWTTKSVRTSVESAPRFRTVASWVNHQTNRPSVKEKLADLGMEGEPSVPPTPAEFRHHPGAPVSFLAQHGRQESAELDKQFTNGR